MSDDGAKVGMVLIPGFIALVVITAVTSVGWVGPDTFVGDRPDLDHALVCSSGRGYGGCGENLRESTLTWTVAPGRTTSTRVSATEGEREPETFHQMFGTLEIDDPDECPAVVAWTLTPLPGPDRPPGPTLTEQAPEVDVGDLPVPRTGSSEVRLDLRRLDPLPCRATVAWTRASVK